VLQKKFYFAFLARNTLSFIFFASNRGCLLSRKGNPLFLLDLVETKDGKNTSIYIRGVENKIKEIWEEISKKNWRKLNVRKLIPQNIWFISRNFLCL